MLTQLSNQIADVVAAAAPAVVQVQGGRRPASGLVFGAEAVLTTMRVLGREDGARVRRSDGEVFDGQLAGWDPATRIAVLRVPGLAVDPVQPGTADVRVGHLAVAVGRSWSNSVTASAGLVSVIGGPLRTSRRHAIERVFRTSAPMHEGFAGGAVLDGSGSVIGVATAAAIRGLGVVIPATIAWTAAVHVLEHGGARRGYLGIAVQPVRVSDRQAAAAGREDAVLVVAVKGGSPAADAGLLVGDVLLSLDGTAIGGPDDLLDLLRGDRIGRSVALDVLRGGAREVVQVTIADRA